LLAEPHAGPIDWRHVGLHDRVVGDPGQARRLAGRRRVTLSRARCQTPRGDPGRLEALPGKGIERAALVAQRRGVAKRALAALENGQPTQPVEQIKEATVVGGDVVTLDALRAFGNVGQEMADLARPARVSNVDEA
jgi:hypothetical protein